MYEKPNPSLVRINACKQHNFKKENKLIKHEEI